MTTEINLDLESKHQEISNQLEDLLKDFNLKQALSLIDETIVKMADSPFKLFLLLNKLEILFLRGQYSRILEIIQKISDYERIDIRTASLLEMKFYLIKNRTNIVIGKDPQIIKNELNEICNHLSNALTTENEFFFYVIEELLGEIAFFHEDDYDLAIGKFQTAKEYYFNNNQYRNLARVNNRIAEILRLKGQLDNSLSILNSNLEFENEIKNSPELADTIHHLGNLLTYKGQISQAKDHYEKAMVLRLKFGNKLDLSKSLNNLGNCSTSMGDLDTALKYFEESLQYKRDIGNKFSIHRAINNIGVIYLKKGEYEKALNNFLQSLEYFDSTNNALEIAEILNNIGQVHRDSGKYNESLEVYFSALKKWREIENQFEIGTIYTKIGEIYSHLGDLNTALEYLNQALEIKYELENKNEIALTLILIGNVFRKMGEISSSLTHLNQALEISQSQRDNILLAHNYHELGITFKEMGSNKAEEYFLKSLELKESVGNRIEIAKTLYYLIDFYLANNNYKKADQYIDKFKLVNFELNNLVIDSAFDLINAKRSKFNIQEYDREKIKNIYKTILSNELDYDIAIDTIKSLGELLIDEISLQSGDLDYYNKAIDIIDELNVFGEASSSLIVKIELNILNARIHLFHGDLTLSKQLLEEAKEIAESKNLGSLIQRLNFEITHLVQNFELMVVNKKLRQSNADLQNYATILSHDLKEPLHVIRQSSQILAENIEDDSGKNKKFLDMVISGTERMVSIIDGLAQFSKIKIEHENLTNINLNSIIETITSIDLAHKIQDTQAVIKIKGELPVIRGYENLIGQLFKNLIENGIKYASEGVIPKIDISCTETKSFYLIQVSDNGIGIEEENHKKIFDLFSRVRQNKPIEGSGIGLAICNRIVDLHNGEIEVHSNVGEGTDFTISLPKVN